MKGDKEHRVPLSKPPLAILEEMAKLKDGSGLVCPQAEARCPGVTIV
jgi:hypothetical protein